MHVLTVRHLALVNVLLLVLAGCAHRHDARQQPAAPVNLAPVPAIAPDDTIKTVAAYTQVAEAAREALPKSLTEVPGPKRLITATRALAACKSEAARAYARSLITLLKKYKIDAGPLPPPGEPVITYAELATVEALSDALMRGPNSSKQGPVPAGPDTIPFSLHVQMLVLISRDCPADGASFLAAFNTTNPLPADISLDSRLSLQERQQLYAGAWANFCAHFTDPARPVNFTCAELASSSYTFGYAVYYASNALASVPEVPITGREVRDLGGGYIRMRRAIRALDPKFKPDGPASTEPANERGDMACIMDDNIAATRAARADITRFFNALAANDDATVKAISDDPKLQTAAQWREYIGLDRPTPIHSLVVLGFIITESHGKVSVTIQKTDTNGKVDTDHCDITVRKRGGHWRIRS